MLRRDQALLKVTPAQIQEVARRAFVPSNRTVAVLVRPDEAGSAPAGSPHPGGGARQ
jgi:predicted Zn-dependent peptidase